MIPLPPITKTQQSIIILIYRYRFLSRLHLQQLLNHTSPQKINLWLKDLTEKDYINRIYSTKLGDNTKPAIYYIGINTIRYIKLHAEIDKDKIKKLYHEKYRSLGFQEHCTAVTDFVCNLQSFARKQEKTANILTKVDYTNNSDNELNLILQTLVPDVYYTCDVTGIAQACFVEVIDEHIPSYVLRGKIVRYIQAIQEADSTLFSVDRFPSVAFLLPTMKKLRSLQRIIKILRNELDDIDLDEALRCNLATISDIQTKSIADGIWIKA